MWKLNEIELEDQGDDFDKRYEIGDSEEGELAPKLEIQMASKEEPIDESIVPLQTNAPQDDEISLESADLEMAPLKKERAMMTRDRLAKIAIFGGAIIVLIAASVSMSALKKKEDNLPSNTDIFDAPLGNDEAFESPPEVEPIPDSPEVVSEPKSCSYNNLIELLDGEIYVNEGFQVLSSSDPNFFPRQLAFNWMFNLPEGELDLCNPYKVVETFALATLYFSAGGEDWPQQFNFLESVDVCKWSSWGFSNGIFCDKDKITVITVRLSENNLTGPIPEEIGKMTNLQKLIMDKNQMTGSIPSEISNLKKLQTISLGENFFTGSIPYQFGKLSDLHDLKLMDNILSGSIPTQLCNAFKLTHVRLDENALRGKIPTEIGKLDRLESLILSSNGLRGPIPEELGFLSSLKTLQLYRNKLTATIPSSFERLQKLDQLDLYENRISGEIPTELGELSSVEFLQMHSNNLEGSIPSELGKLSNLVVLSLYDNNLSGSVPTTMKNLNQLVEFDVLWGTSITGDFSFMCDIDPLKIWYVCSEQDPPFSPCTCCICWEPDTRTTSIPIITPSPTSQPVALSSSFPTNETISSLSPTSTPKCYDDTVQLLLSEINIDLDALSTPFTSEQKAFVWLSSLSTGQLDLCRPYEVVQKYVLALLYYATNGENWNLQLDFLTNDDVCSWNDGSNTGVFCEDDKVTVSSVRILGNRLNGKISSELSNLINLEKLNLDGNSLSGNIPSELGGLTRLSSFSLSGNNLKGSIPTELFDLTNIHDIKLWENKLTGSIPSEIGKASKLTHFRLDRNKFEGTIPSEVGNLVMLRSFALYDNKFSGGIPSEIGLLKLATSLLLEENRLSGEIPSEIGGMESLEELYLDYNKIRGTIPTELGHLNMLKFLEMHRNKIEGTIPSELGNLSHLSSFSAYGNKLVGTVPNFLIRLDHLDDLDILYGNDITGDFSFMCEIDNITMWYVCEQQELSVSQCDCCQCWEFPNPTRECGIEQNPEYESLEALLKSEMNFIPSMESDDLSPQEEAYNWLSNMTDDNLLLCDTYFVIERFVLAVLYHNTKGAIWDNQFNFLSAEDICSWHDSNENGTYRGVFCDDMKPYVTRIEIEQNGLDGWLPTELGLLDKLLEINFNDNRLSGELPIEISKISELEIFSVKFNALSGAIPSEISSLSSLEVLDVSYNYFTGVLPSWLGNLGYLREFKVSSNLITGSVPSEFGNMVHLRKISVSNNYFSAIPSEIGHLTLLKSFDAENNTLIGSLPTELGHLGNLEYLYLSSNNLKSSIPTKIGNMKKLLFLGLDQNELTGSIPSELGDLSDLRVLSLFSNNLTGDIPTSLLGLDNLLHLDVLSGNDLSLSNDLTEETFCEKDDLTVWVDCQNQESCSCCECEGARR